MRAVGSRATAEAWKRFDNPRLQGPPTNARPARWSERAWSGSKTNPTIAQTTLTGS